MNTRLVQLTLGSHEAYFHFLPTLSGYREKESRKVWFTTNYGPLLHQTANDPDYPLEPDDLQVLLPVESVVSARVFDPGAYERHFEGQLPPPIEEPTDGSAPPAVSAEERTPE